MQRNKKKQISTENYYVMGKVRMQVEINETILGDK